MKIVGVLSRWVERGIIPGLVTRVIVETSRVDDISVEVAGRIREAIRPGIIRGLAQTIQSLGIISGIADVVTHFLTTKKIPLFNMVSFPATLSMIEELEGDRRIAKIFPDRIMYALKYPTVQPDQVFEDKMARKKFTSTYYTRRIVGAEQANKEGYTGRGVKVAVIDTTAAPQHVAVSHAIPKTTIRGLWTDENGHGIWCASAIGGKYYVDLTYGVPTQGLAPDVTLFTIKSLGFVLGFGNESDILEGMEASAILGADIVSMSLGSESVPDRPEDDPQIQAIDKLTKERGMIFSVACGNSGPGYGTVNSPGAAESAITVGAYCPITGRVASFSSRGPTPWGSIKPDIVMPGVNILAPTVGILDVLEIPRGAVRSSALSGTSMATPHASAMIALMMEHANRHGIKLTTEIVKDVMNSYGEDVKNNDSGWGVLTWDKWKRYSREVLGI